MTKVAELASKVLNAAACAICAIFLLLVLWGCLKIFVYDTFPVNTDSMYPTIESGDVIIVNKLIAGARIYRDFDFSDTSRLNAFRMKGFRAIDRNDIVVFNYPGGSGRDPLQFKINSVYVKRCAAIPGDTISIENGIYRNHSVMDHIGLPDIQEKLASTDLPKRIIKAYPFDNNVNWSILNLGPLYVPKSGDVMEMDKRNVIVYRKYIEYETRKKLTCKDGEALLDGVPVSAYRFEKNYYFFAGDNVPDSRDSRYFGLVPEEFIVGVAPRVLYSRHKGACDRTFKTL